MLFRSKWSYSLSRARKHDSSFHSKFKNTTLRRGRCHFCEVSIIYNGKTPVRCKITEGKVGHKFGEFS